MTYKLKTTSGNGQSIAEGLVAFCNAGTVRNYVKDFDGERDIVFIRDLPEDVREAIEDEMGDDDDVLTYTEVE